MTYLSNSVIDSSLNYTTTPLNNAQTFTGTWERAFKTSVAIYAYTDNRCTFYIDFSQDGVNVDSTITSTVDATTNEVHNIKALRPYVRIRITNDSGQNQTYLRAGLRHGDYSTSTSLLNSTVQSDADTILVRPLDFNLMVSEGLYQNRQITIKDGINEDIDTGTVPEDIWDEGGVYTGFPTGTVEEGQIVVAGADTGTVYYSYLASATSTDYVFSSKAIAGAGSYDLGHNIYRCNFAYFISSNPAVFNVGKISIRWKTTTTVVFCAIQIGISQSYCAGYTVPFGSSVYVDRFNGNIKGSASGSLDGFIWYRPYGESPRLRFPFELQFGSLFFDDVDYLVKIPQQVDFIPRIMTASTNNLSAKFSYRLLKVKQ